MASWGPTEPVLRRVRKLTLSIKNPAIGQPNEHEIACANKVWAHLEVEMAGYDEKNNWSFVEKAKRTKVTEKLEAIFDKAAFFVGGRVAARAKRRAAEDEPPKPPKNTREPVLTLEDVTSLEEAVENGVDFDSILAETFPGSHWTNSQLERKCDELRQIKQRNATAARDKFKREHLLAWGTELLAADATPAAAFNPPPPGPGTPAGEPTAKNQDHANAIATVQWPNAYAAIGVHGVTRHSGSLKISRKYSELAAGHERDLVHELRDYEAGGGDLDAIRQHIDDAASARVWDKFLTNYKCFLRTGDDATVDAHGSLAGSSVEVSPARSQDSEDEDEDDGDALGDLGELERKLAIEERAYGRDSKEVAVALTNLGNAYCSLGDHTKARDLLERALEIEERVHGHDSKEVAVTLEKLGEAHYNLGDNAKERNMLERALAIKKWAYGSESKEVAVTLEKLGEAHYNLGDNAKARDVLERSLAINERAYGRDHPEAAITLNNLGGAHNDLGDYSKARNMLERALPIMEREHGHDSKEVAVTLNNLGNAYNGLCDYAKARDVLEPALAIRKRAYGPEHPEVAIALNNLGAVYCRLGDYAKARDVLEPALAINERAYGSESKEVAQTLDTLGYTYNELGDYAKTRDVLEPALPIMERAYGSKSKEVARTLNNLGLAYGKSGDHAKQRDALVRALPIMEREHGSDHAIVDLARKKIVELEKEHGLDHSNVGSALENAANADLMSEDIGTWTCSGSVENVSKRTWKSRSRDGSSRGGERRPCLRSDSANLDQADMELDSESLLNEAMSMVSL